MDLIKLICTKSKYTGDLCDFTKGNHYVGIYIKNTLMVDGNHGDLHMFDNKGEGFFELAGPNTGICYCGEIVTEEMEDTVYSVDQSGNQTLIHVDCGYERYLERQFGI